MFRSSGIGSDRGGAPPRALLVAGLAGLLLFVAATVGPASGSITNAGSVCRHLTTAIGSGSGNITFTPNSSGGCPFGYFSDGYMITVHAVASGGYTFDQWTGTDNDGTNPTNVTMDANRHVTAYFVSNCFTLSYSVAGGGGSIYRTPASAGGCPTNQYPPNYIVTVSANPAVGYVWNTWSGTDNNNTNPTTVTMSSNRSIQATFQSNCVQLTTAVGSGSGTVQVIPTESGNCGYLRYSVGYVVTLSANPSTGYEWVFWTGTDDNYHRITTVTLGTNKTVTAYFAAPGQTVTPPPPTVTPTRTRTPTPGGPTPTRTPTSRNQRPGDANCDTNVNAVDAVFVLQLAAGRLSDVPCPPLANVNGDGQINAIDAVLILQYTAGLIGGLPVG